MLKVINYVLICFILIPTIKPDGISHTYVLIDRILYNNYSVILAFILSFFMLLLSLKKNRISIITMLLWMSFIYLLIVTFLNNGPITSLATTWLKSIIICNLFETYKNDLFKPLRCIQIILEILVTANLLLIILYRDGMYTNEVGYTDCWLLGYKSTFQYYFFLLLTITILFRIYMKERKNFIFVIVMIHIETILVWNAMFIVALAIIDVCLILNIMKKSMLFNVKTCTTVICGINIGFIFLGEYIFNMRFVYYLLNTVLQKNSTLLIRFDIWKTGLEYIKASPIIGYGFTTSREMLSWFGIHQVHLHNQFLMILLQGGIIWLILFCLFMYFVLKQLNKHKNLESSRIILLIIFAVFISVIVEIFTTGNAYLIWPIFILGYYTKEIDLQFEREIMSTKKKLRKFKFR